MAVERELVGPDDTKDSMSHLPVMKNQSSSYSSSYMGGAGVRMASMSGLLNKGGHDHLKVVNTADIDKPDDEFHPGIFDSMLAAQGRDSFMFRKGSLKKGQMGVSGKTSFEEVVRRTSFGPSAAHLACFQTCQSIRGPDLSHIGKTSSCMGLSFEDGPNPTFKPHGETGRQIER